MTKIRMRRPCSLPLVALVATTWACRAPDGVATAEATSGGEVESTASSSLATSSSDAEGSTDEASSSGIAETSESTSIASSESSSTGEPDACERVGRFDVERFTDEQVALVDDVVFATTGTTLDLYVPDAALEPCPTRPVLLMVHGGAWVVGQKEWMDARARFHARRGLVVATVDYRKTTSDALCSGDGWDRAAYRAMQDVRAAAQLVVAEADMYAIDPSAIFLYGNSAGAITTLSLALTDEAAIDTVLASIVADEGELSSVSLHPELDAPIRAMYTQAGALFEAALLASDAPRPSLLLMHSEGDASVPYATGGSAVCPGAPLSLVGSSSLRDAVDGPGECVALVQVEGDTHDLDEVYGERCDAVDPPCMPSRMDETADRFFSAVMSSSCESQHSFCTAASCELVEGQPEIWFTLFP